MPAKRSRVFALISVCTECSSRRSQSGPVQRICSSVGSSQHFLSAHRSALALVQLTTAWCPVSSSAPHIWHVASLVSFLRLLLLCVAKPSCDSFQANMRTLAGTGADQISLYNARLHLALHCSLSAFFPLGQAVTRVCMHSLLKISLSFRNAMPHNPLGTYPRA
jgi:hypothetical protein